MHKGVGLGGFDPPPPSQRKMYRVGGEERKRKEKGKNQAKIGKIRLKIGKRGGNRRKSSNLAKNRYVQTAKNSIIIC